MIKGKVSGILLCILAAVLMTLWHFSSQFLMQNGAI